MAGDTVWIDVLPSMAGFAKDLTSGATKAGQDAGKASGSAWSKAFGQTAGDGGSKAVTDELIENEKRATRAVDNATVEIGKARAAQRSAAATTLLAEQKLADTIEKFGQDSKQAEAASLRLEAAREKEKLAADKTERSIVALKAASNEAKEATEQLAKATKDATEDTEKAGGAWDTVKEKVGGFKDSLANAATSVGGFVATAAGAVGAAQVWSDAWADAMDLSKSTAKLSAALDLTEEESARAGDAAGALFADSYGESMEDVTGAVESVLSSFKGMRDASAEDLQAVTGQAMSLAQAFDLDVSEAVTAAGGLIKNGLASDATGAFDLITASLQKVPAAMRGDVLDAANEYGTFFKTLGIEGPEAMGMLAASAEGGVIAIDKTGDALKEFTIRGTDMSKNTVAAYKDMGLKWQDVTNDLLAGGDKAKGAFGKVVDGLKGIKDPGDQAAAAIALFGTPLEDLNVSEIPAFLDSLDTMDSGLGNVAGKAGELDSKMSETVDPIDSVKRSLMGILTDALEPLVEPLQDFSQWAEDNPALMQGVAIAFGILTLAIGVATVAWGAMTLAASPWIITAAVIAAVIAAAVAIIVVVVKKWGDITEWLGEVVQKVGDWIGRVWEGIKEAISKAWAAVKDALKAGWDWIKENVIQKFVDGWNWVVEKFRGVKDSLASAWDRVKEALKAGWDWIFENVVQRYINAWNNVKDKFGNVKDSIVGVWGKLKDSLKAGWDWIGDKVFDPMKKGVDAIGKTFDKTKDFIGKAWDKIKESAAKPVNFIIETVYTKGIKNVWDTIAGKVGLDLRLPTVKPIKFAEGGVLPGYTPGRDVHDFYSPTAGRLSLSGGEAIMRPEFTRAAGGEAGIHRLNALARMGQLGQHLAFAGGGVWDRVKSGAKGAWNWTADKAGKAWDWTKNTAESVANFVSDPIAAITDLIGKPVQNLLGKVAPGFVGDVLKQVPGKFLNSLGDWAKSALFGREVEGAAAPGGGGIGMGYKAMVALLKGRFPDLQITSTYRPGAITATGYPSMHGMGRAVDMAPRMDVFNWLRSAYPNSRELIYSPAGGRQLYNGRNHYYTGITRDMHFNHVHWGMAGGGVLPKNLNFGTYDTGGVLPPGDTLVSNKTGLPELVLNPQQIDNLGQPRGPIELGERTIERLSDSVAEKLGVVGDTVRDVRDAVEGARRLERMG